MELKTGSDLSVRCLHPRPDTAGAEETDEGRTERDQRGKNDSRSLDLRQGHHVKSWEEMLVEKKMNRKR